MSLGRREHPRYAAVMVTSAPDIDEAARLRHAMVDRWVEDQLALSGPVEQAMRTVPRHRFLPEFPVAESYTESIPITHRDTDGTVLSCATLPICVAQMLEQLDVRPGHRVLEIGAGTGYNAALLAHLDRPNGQVTTIDTMPAVVDEARRQLSATGYEAVRVVCGDGALGHAEGAPYDRIIVTAGAWDIPPAWLNQAAPGARIVVPLRISGFTHMVALTRDERADGQVWRSQDHQLTGFIQLRGPGHHPEHDVPIVPGGEAELRVEGDLPADPAALRHATAQPPVKLRTGVKVADPRLSDLEIWLASLGGVGRLICRRPGHGLAPTVGDGGSLAVLDTATGDTFAYFTLLPTEHIDDGPERELGIHAYGPRAGELAEQVADRVRAWAEEHPTITTWIEIHPVGAAIPPGSILVADKRDSRVIVRGE